MDRQLATELIERYTRSWIERDLSLLLTTVSPEVVVAECNGPVYRGVDQVRRWFTDWHKSPKEGQVSRWEIRNVLFDGAKRMAAVEWRFACVCEGQPGSFLGASVFCFDESRIIRIHEYQMDENQYAPYG